MCTLLNINPRVEVLRAHALKGTINFTQEGTGSQTNCSVPHMEDMMHPSDPKMSWRIYICV
jgi:hypothetical protein